METLSLRWEELGIKEAQLKAHMQKFEQFIQVPLSLILLFLFLLLLLAFADSSRWIRCLFSVQQCPGLLPLCLHLLLCVISCLPVSLCSF